MVALLFAASVMLPFLLPPEWTPPALASATLAYTVVAAAYIAEALRGGIQAVPKGQSEAAGMLALSRWQIQRAVVLPQALRHAMPGLVAVSVIFVKETALVTMVGMTDFFGATRLASRDSNWLGFDVEGLVVAALAYFALCSVVAACSTRIERHLGR